LAIAALHELNGELVRLFAAGSRLAFGDPRLKKFVPLLQKYGERAPVMQKLAEAVQALVETDPAESAKKLMEAEALLLSVLSTQGESLLPQEVKADNNDGVLGETWVGYRALAPLVEALASGRGRKLEIVRTAFEDGYFSDPRLYKFAEEVNSLYGQNGQRE